MFGEIRKGEAAMSFKQLSKKEKALKILYFVVLASFILPLIYLSVQIAFAPAVDDDSMQKSDYILMIVECMLGIIVINIPSMISKTLKYDIPVFLNVLYMIFLYCAIFLGEVRRFYYVVPHWDVILHCMSSMMLGLFGFMFVYLINKDKKTAMSLSPFFVALFAFCFALSIEIMWEIYEFTFDGLLGLNMQKFRLEDGTLLTGREALGDTMKDIIIDAVGSFIATVIGYVSLKNGKPIMGRMHGENDGDTAEKGGNDAEKDR